jgi:nucleoside-diphosphate-sugar epimerase
MGERIENEAELEARLSAPTAEVCDLMGRLEGDLLLLGVGGKMGPTIAKMAKRAIVAAGVRKRVIGVSRFSSGGLQRELEAAGIETIAADLLADDALDSLPDAANVLYLVGMKFGTTGAEAMTWAMNALLPGLVARRYRGSRIVALSTGNVYPLTDVATGGPTEEHPVGPIGEYAQSCLGRERVFQYGSEAYGTPVTLLRLNYAIEMRYGVLLDIARTVHAGRPVDLRMGYVNVIWQGDAAEVTLRAFDLCASPPAILNLTGPETVSVRDVANRFGALFGKPPIFDGTESETALLSNASRCQALFGGPRVSLEQMIEWVAHWVAIGGRTLDKPTHFDQRDGKF